MQLIDVARRVVQKGFVMVKDNPAGGVFVSNQFPELHEANQVVANMANENFMVLDTFTASHFVQVYDALSERNQAKMNTYDVVKQIGLMWTLLDRVKVA